MILHHRLIHIPNTYTVRDTLLQGLILDGYIILVCTVYCISN
jgi:hypothetical protein